MAYESTITLQPTQVGPNDWVIRFTEVEVDPTDASNRVELELGGPNASVTLVSVKTLLAPPGAASSVRPNIRSFESVVDPESAAVDGSVEWQASSAGIESYEEPLARIVLNSAGVWYFYSSPDVATSPLGQVQTEIRFRYGWNGPAL